MPQSTLTQRVTVLERRMDDVEPRVATIETELKAFRVEVRQEFAAVRTEMTALGGTLRGETAALGETLRGEMAALGETLRRDLRKEIRDGDEETRRLMRVLHEDLVERITKIGEGSHPANGRRRSRKG